MSVTTARWEDKTSAVRLRLGDSLALAAAVCYHDVCSVFVQSTGLPIQVRSATSPHKPISYCKLYIDINRNRPEIAAHEHHPNPTQWQGTEISVVIGGAWTRYQSKIVNYIRQLAVITPYASLQLEFIDQENESKSWTILFDRRTDVMPSPPLEVKHHPSSVNNLLVEQLIHHAKPKTRVAQFLTTSFSAISASLADRLCEEMASDFDTTVDVQTLGKTQIHQLTQILRSAKFAMPDAAVRTRRSHRQMRRLTRTAAVVTQMSHSAFVIVCGACVSASHPQASTTCDSASSKSSSPTWWPPPRSRTKTHRQNGPDA